MRELGISAIVITCVLCSFFADKWAMESADEWGKIGGAVLIIGGFALLFEDWRDRKS